MNVRLRRLLPLFLLASLASAPATAQGNLDSAHLEVHRGRVVMLSGGQGERTLRTGDAHVATGATHIEVGTGAEVRLSWPGSASLHVWGPSSVQWQVEAPPAGSPAGTAPTLKWSVQELAWCDLEVRRGKHKLSLPGSWTAQVGPGAVYLRGLPSGPVELRLHAGEAVRLDWSGEASQARPPVLVNPGSSVRLERPTAAPADKSSQAKAWDRSAEWPYRSAADTARQRAERQSLAQRTQRQDPWPAPKGSIKGATNRRSQKLSQGPAIERLTAPQPKRKPLHVRSAPSRRSIELSASERSSLEAPSVTMESQGVEPIIEAPVVETVPPSGSVVLPSQRSEDQARPVVVAKPEPIPVQEPVIEPPVQSVVQPVVPSPASETPAGPVEPTAETPVASVPFVKSDWGGLDYAELIPCGEFAVEKALGVEVRMFGGGRHKVLVDSKAAGPVRVFTSAGDQRLHPGAVAVFEADGTVRMGFGKIEPLGVAKDRAAFVNVKK